MRAAAAFALLALCLFAQDEALPPLAEALKQEGPQAVLRKPPAGRSRSEILAFLHEEPVEFTTRVRQRLQELTQRDQAQSGALAAGYRDLLRRMEERRIDKQIGGDALASPGSAPRILGVAVQSGALEQSGSGALTTFRGNLLGVSRWLLGAEPFPYCDPTTPRCGQWTDALRGLAFHVSFDAPHSGGAPERMQSWGARWEFINRRDPRDARFRRAWRDAGANEKLRASRESFAGAREALLGFVASELYQNLMDQLVTELQNLEAGSTTRAAEAIENYIDRAATIARREPGWRRRAADAQAAQAQFTALRDKLVSEALTRMSYAVEFNTFRPASGAPYSDARFVISGSPVKNDKVLVTGNAGISWWRLAEKNRHFRALRDIEAAVRLDRAAGGLSDSVDLIWTLAGSYRCERNTRAAALEARLTLSVRGTPLKIPFAVVWTRENGERGRRDARASGGITLDWDAVLAGLGR